MKSTLSILFLSVGLAGLGACDASPPSPAKPKTPTTSGSSDGASVDVSKGGTTVPEKAPSLIPGELPAPAETTAENTTNATPAAPPPMPVPQELPPLQFLPELPKDQIASVNGVPVTADALLQIVLEQNFMTGVQSLMAAKIVDLELARDGIKLTEDAIEDEVRVILEKSAPGKTLDDLRASGKISVKQIERHARTMRGWKELYWLGNNVPESQRHEETHPMIIQLWMKRKMDNYENRIRGATPGPIPGTAAQIIDKTNNSESIVTASEALDFLIGLATYSALTQAREDLIDRVILDQALAKASVTVTEAEARQWATEMRTKYAGPLGWDQICRYKNTTPEREMDRWRRIQAYKRIHNYEPTEEEIQAFLNEHRNYFYGEYKKVSHILLQTVDPETGLGIPEKEAEAEKRIQALHQKLEEGLEFNWMAETYSDDRATAQGQGRLSAPVKELGTGGYDPAFHAAAWKLDKVGQISPPVRSKYGWHVIKLDEYARAAAKEIDWNAPSFRDWLLDDFMTAKADAFMQSLRDQAKIERQPDTMLFELKERSYLPK